MKDLSAAKKIPGIEIRRDRSSKKLWLSQQGYTKKVLDRFGMNSAKPIIVQYTRGYFGNCTVFRVININNL